MRCFTQTPKLFVPCILGLVSIYLFHILFFLYLHIIPHFLLIGQSNAYNKYFSINTFDKKIYNIYKCVWSLTPPLVERRMSYIEYIFQIAFLCVLRKKNTPKIACFEEYQSGFYLVLENVALSKYALQLHPYENPRYSDLLGAANVVDGLKTNLSFIGGQCTQYLYTPPSLSIIENKSLICDIFLCCFLRCLP